MNNPVDTLTQKFITTIKQRNTHHPNTPQWEDQNTKADAIINEVCAMGIARQFSEIVNQHHHWQ